MTQEEFAELVKIDTKMISKIETGNSFTSAENIENICNAFKISPDKLFKINFKFDAKNDKTKAIEEFVAQISHLDIDTINMLAEMNNVIVNKYDRK